MARIVCGDSPNEQLETLHRLFTKGDYGAAKLMGDLMIDRYGNDGPEGQNVVKRVLNLYDTHAEPREAHC